MMKTIYILLGVVVVEMIMLLVLHLQEEVLVVLEDNLYFQIEED